MEAKELRIGNWVYPDMSYPDPVKVCSKDFINTEHLNPIPLTEEWLLKFDGNCTIMKGYPIYFLNPFNIEFYEFKCLFYIGNRSVKIKHVHELQNLYYALTNQELTIKY